MFSETLRDRILLLSPLAVIGLCHLTARATESRLGAWAWIATLVVFWSMIAGIVAWSRRGRTPRRWLEPSRGSMRWRMLAIAISLIPLPIFLLNWRLLSPTHVVVLWVVFASLNPWFEEIYWRGALLDASSRWPSWAGILYSSLVFSASHPLIWGIHSIGNRTLEVTISTFVMGVAWATLYTKTRSLRWAVASHALVDLFALSVPVFLNTYVPR